MNEAFSNQWMTNSIKDLISDTAIHLYLWESLDALDCGYWIIRNKIYLLRVYSIRKWKSAADRNNDNKERQREEFSWEFRTMQTVCRVIFISHWMGPSQPPQRPSVRKEETSAKSNKCFEEKRMLSIFSSLFCTFHPTERFVMR